MPQQRHSPVPPGCPSVPAARSRAVPWWLGVAVVVLVTAAAVWLWGPRRAPTAAAGGRVESAAPPSAVVEAQEAVFARYAGSATCRACHALEHAAWAASHHGLAERVVQDDLERPAFDPPRTFTHGSQTTAVAWNGGAPTVTAPGLGNRREPLQVTRVIGHDPLRQFLAAFPGGRWQALEAAWDPRTNTWFNVYGSEDRQPGEWGHWSGRGMTWNSMCGPCHNTRYRKNYEVATDTFRTAMAEPAVGCEACHGPLQEHVHWQRAGPAAGQPDPTVRQPAPVRSMEICAPCHARRSEFTGDFVPGEAFWDHYLLAIVDASPVFHPDGQIGDEVYEYAPFLGSRMHAAGVTCLDCHDPHTARLKLAGNALCLQCHNGSRAGAPVIDPAQHSFHHPDSAGSLCVNCHMPQTVYMQKHGRHDHGFTSPDPLLTQRFGIPNACNPDQDAAWALATCTRWYGARMERPARARALVLAQARRGEAAAVEPLLARLALPEPPYWQAAAVALLAPWIGQPAVTEGVRQQLTHTHPLVRYYAVQALAPLAVQGDARVLEALAPRLEDSARAVRVAAAWALRAQLQPTSRAGLELQHLLTVQADQPAGQAQTGLYALARGHPDEALAHYARAVAWDPGSPDLRHDYAVALSLAGRAQEALEQTRAAARLQPLVADNHYRLGLAWAAAGDLGQAIAALAEAVRLDPRHDRAAYNLGLAYQQAGDTAQALAWLGRAEQANPHDARIPYARATILAQAGQPDAARAAARRVLELEPTHGPARKLLTVLGP